MMAGAVGQFVNKASKWIALCAATSVLLWRRDRVVLWAITGSLANAANAKLLKRCINQQRPESASWVNKLDPGMPSSHAQSLGYLATYAALGILDLGNGRPEAMAGAAAVVAAAAYMSHLRVATGLHTKPQVVAGVVIGAATAVAWHWLWRSKARDAMDDLPWAAPLLNAAFATAALAFALYALKDWRLGDL